MLSAVAARKARLAGKQGLPQVTLPPPPTSTPPKVAAPTHQTATPTRPSTKRKPNETVGRSEKKQKRPQKPIHDALRYFEQDAFKEQHDVIGVGDDSDDSDRMPLDDALVSASNLSTSANGDAMAVEAPRRRAWSPSEPLRDSSDEEEEEEAMDEKFNQGVTSLLPIAGPSRVAPKVLSTFHPVLDQNMFFLTLDDAHTAPLSLSEDSPVGTLLILRPLDTLALLGTYRLTVLQGAVSLMGSVLTASHTSHRVFAPRSSPVPVLQSTEYHGPSQPLPMPGRMRPAVGHDAAVILLQDLQTDVGRLGLVCRTFEGVFSPPRAQSKMPNVNLNLNSAHLVRPCVSTLDHLLISARLVARRNV